MSVGLEGDDCLLADAARAGMVHGRTVRTLSEKKARQSLPQGYSEVLDGTFTSSGVYTGHQLTGTFALRYSKRRFNATAGLRLTARDILGQNVNMVRRFAAGSRQISTYNGIGRYVMLHFSYRFKSSGSR